MRFTITLPLFSLLASSVTSETILGAYIFHRHGDRTPKALAPTNLTTLGYEQVFTSGQYFRSRYLTGPKKIRGINQDQVKLSQLSVTAPVDNVLQNSAQGFLQGLYPPVETVQNLANGKPVQAPMDGYQLIPINTISTGAGSEDAGWLQDATSCYNAKVSSNRYFDSASYKKIASSTKDFYTSLVPVVNGTLNAQDVTFKNGYIVYDLINVATIHNASIPASKVLTPETLFQTRALADAHEWGLAYDAEDNVRAIAGMQLAGEILKYMNSTIAAGIAGSTANKLGIQFGAYATMLSFFGLADLYKTNSDFQGIPDYASALTFELFTDSDDASFPAAKDLQVRFLFNNGTVTNSSQPTIHSLFGGDKNAVSWTEFSSVLSRFAVSSTEQWCGVCGKSSGTGTCAALGSASTGAEKESGRMSPVIGGVIGAFVTLAVVLGSLSAVMLIGGFGIVKKKAAVGKVVEVTKV